MNLDPSVPRTVGLKQSAKAIRSGRARRVLLADDADDAIRQEILTLCKDAGLEAETVPSKASLGKACGIECSAAVVALLK